VRNEERVDYGDSKNSDVGGMETPGSGPDFGCAYGKRLGEPLVEALWLHLCGISTIKYVSSGQGELLSPKSPSFTMEDGSSRPEMSMLSCLMSKFNQCVQKDT
jgi:hypothetical protein